MDRIRPPSQLSNDSQKVAYEAHIMLVKEAVNHMILTAQLFSSFNIFGTGNARYTYLTTDTLTPSSSATSGSAGVNELVTKTLSHVTTGKKCRGVVSQASRPPLNERRKGHTRDETGPCDKGDDGPFAAGRKSGVDKIVIGFNCCFWNQQGALFCCHGVRGNSEACGFRQSRLGENGEESWSCLKFSTFLNAR